MNYPNRKKKNIALGASGCLVVAGLLIAVFVALCCVLPTAGGYILNWIWPQVFTFWKGFWLTFIVAVVFGTKIKLK